MQSKKMLLNRLAEINKVLIKNSAEFKNHDQLGVLSGISGIALFQFYYAQYLDTEEFAEMGLENLTLCIEKINEGFNLSTYCGGLAGMGWTFNHLKENGFIEVEDELLVDFDDYLYRSMLSFNKVGNYDFLHGAVGDGLYFFKRYKSTTNSKLKARYKKYLLELIDSLNIMSEADGDKIKWFSIIDIKSGLQGYNLGLSHGIPSIVNFLSRLYVYDDFKVNVEEMLLGGIKYILSFMSSDKKSLSLFPNYVIKGEEILWKTRLAWCYGDLGIGLSLWHASVALGEISLKNTAIEILKHSAKRTSAESSMIMDAGICHGSFGNAQIFNYMYGQTNIDSFKKAGEFWIEDGLKKAAFQDGYAGYKKWAENQWQNDLFILTGIAGIGLSIISYLVEGKINWDECLMIS